MDRYGQILIDMDYINNTHICTDIDTCFKYKLICIDMYGYNHICTDIGLIHTDMSVYWLYMHRYGHIWFVPGLIWEPVDNIDKFNHINRYTHMNRYERKHISSISSKKYDQIWTCRTTDVGSVAERLAPSLRRSWSGVSSACCEEKEQVSVVEHVCLWAWTNIMQTPPE